jgi:hypothetical protein
LLEPPLFARGIDEWFDAVSVLRIGYRTGIAETLLRSQMPGFTAYQDIRPVTFQRFGRVLFSFSTRRRTWKGVGKLCVLPIGQDDRSAVPDYGPFDPTGGGVVLAAVQGQALGTLKP